MKIFTETQRSGDRRAARQFSRRVEERIAVGAITHSAPATDIGLDIEI